MSLSTLPRVVVIGGGITGRLAKTVIPSALVLDWREPTSPSVNKLTRQYGANYLWEPLDGFQHRSFPVVTHIDGRPATMDAIIAYKAKVGKTADVGTWDDQFRTETTGYDLVEFPPVDIRFNAHVLKIDPANSRIALRGGEWIAYDMLISTVPMYALLGMLRWEINEKFRFQPIYIKVGPRTPDAPHPPEVVYVNYISTPGTIVYRVTDRDNERHYESLGKMDGIVARKVLPGKIYPFENAARLLRDLRQHEIYCFGRFASWNPEELVHHTYAELKMFAKEKELA